MLNDKFLQKWVPIIVPPEFGPDKNKNSDKPLLGVYLSPLERMEQIKKEWCEDGEVQDGETILGMLVDMGSLLEIVTGRTTLKDKYLIKLNASQPELVGIFSLAHEIGHLDGEINNPEEHEKNPDEYADKYAFRRIKEAVDNGDLRREIFFAKFSMDRKDS